MADQHLAEEALECPMCLTLPEGEVHQCNEGHCYCVTCWRALDPRRCPECRQPIQDSNRSRATERAIAALEATCDHCAVVTTRGAMAAHLRACPHRPTECAAATAGCGWSGMAAELVIHEEACPTAVCQRMMAPLLAQLQQLQSRDQLQQLESQHLRARVAALEPLQAQNQQLLQQVAALQPLAGRMRALEGDAEAGGRRQRQRVGAAPHDAPPSSAAFQQMGGTEAVAALHAYVAVAHVAVGACTQVASLCHEEGNRQAAAEAGALEAVVAAMWAHPQVAGVQVQGCRALANVCCGSDAAGPARRQQAAEAGALEAAVAAMQVHRQVADSQDQGCRALGNMCAGSDAAALARKQRAVAAGGRGAAAAALQAHPGHADVQRLGQMLVVRLRE